MIVKIQPPNAGIIAAMRYNENKMSGIEGPRPEDEEALEIIENGHILATRNVPDDTSLLDEFERLRLLSIKKRRSGPVLQNTAFHMSVNPSKGDKKLTEEEAIILIDEIMESLGYGKQPYRIYKHTDIPRQHYHVVSCRAGQDGKKIEDSFERMKLRRALRQMTEKYGFEIILNDYEKEQLTEKTTKKETKKETKDEAPKQETHKEKKKTPVREPSTRKTTFVPPFSRDAETPVTTQYRNIVEDALLWHFSTFEQLQLLMLRRYNVYMEIENGHTKDRIVLTGTKASGEMAHPMNEKELGIDLLNRIQAKLDNERMSSRKEQKKRLEGLAKAAADASNSYKDFLKNMEKKGVWIFLSWKATDDDVFGVTYLDRATKCAWKGSETDVDLTWLKGIAEAKGWKLEKDPIKQKMEKRNQMPSRRATLKPKTDFNPTSKPAQPTQWARRFQAGYQQGSNADVTKNRDELLDKNKDNKPKEYIGE